jgi:hypothetical protein
MPETATRGKPACPACGSTNVEPRSVVVGVQPYPRPEPPNGRRPTRVVERKYRCQDCGDDFAIVEEIFD